MWTGALSAWGYRGGTTFVLQDDNDYQLQLDQLRMIIIIIKINSNMKKARKLAVP